MMSGNVTTFDFETKDPYLGKRYGAGWPYPGDDFKVLGCAFRFPNGDTTYETDLDKVKDILQQSSVLVAHNLQYDAGIALRMGVNIKNIVLIDTAILAALYNNAEDSFSLNALSKKYFDDNKSSEPLGRVAQELGIVKTKAMDPVKHAMLNMDLIQAAAPNLVAEYAIHDTVLCHKLYTKYIKTVNQETVLFYSDLLKSLLYARQRGVLVDTNRAEEVADILQDNIEHHFGHIANESDKTIDLDFINSSKQIEEMVKTNYPNLKYPTTEKGNPSFKTEWLESNKEVPLFHHIAECRKYLKAKGDFVTKILDICNYTNNRIYPELNIMRAKTGRFSSTGPNIQQIPKRDIEIGPLARSMYVADPGTKWYSLDYSAQEPRLQVHFAAAARAKGAEELKQAFIENPALDLHDKIADLIDMDRSFAKMINLGISYGMGRTKLASQLAVPDFRARELLDQYNTEMPYLKYLYKLCESLLKNRGHLISLGGRKIRGEKGFEYKGLNLLIQGSAADQTMKAMVEAYREGIDFMFPVHDEIDMCTDDPRQVTRMKEIMETCYELQVPSLVEVTCGPNWGQQEEF